MGKAEFSGLALVVDERVFIPRPETELLAQEVINICHNVTKSQGHKIKILDLCTGSGNIAIALTKEMPDCKIVASDISGEALQVARLNAVSNGVCDRIEFVESDLFSKFKCKFDIIVSNPPYIARREFRHLQKEVLMEPRMALDGGDDGLDFYRRIAEEAPAHLKGDGHLVMEIGYGQAAAIKEIIEKAGYLKVAKVLKDYNGIDRIITARWIN